MNESAFGAACVRGGFAAEVVIALSASVVVLVAWRDRQGDQHAAADEERDEDDDEYESGNDVGWSRVVGCG